MAAPLIETSTHIEATPEKVWSIVSDLARMGEWSPQCRKVIVRGGRTRLGAKTINVNKRGLLVWPTTAVVTRYEPDRQITYRIAENRTEWGFEITPTDNGVTLTERRVAKNGKTTAASAFLIDKLMGGTEPFDDELTEGMRETLTKIKAAAERS
ncbi:SRPBCC family protein [Williamsia sp. M5A3_1d]